MKRVTMLASSLLLLYLVTAVNGETKRESAATPQIIWGKAVRGLQLGISRPAGDEPANDALRVRVHLRSVSMSPVRLLASVHGCAAMGGGAAILVSKLTLKPETDGDPFIISFRGHNHASHGKKGPIEFSVEDAQYFTTELAPSENWPAERVVFALGKHRKSQWRLANESRVLPAGKYTLTAAFTVDQRQSEWKGELRSGPLEVSIAQTDGAQGDDKESE